MWKRMLIQMVSSVISLKILDWVMAITDIQKKAQAIHVLTELKIYLATSTNSTTRAIALIIPFGADL